MAAKPLPLFYALSQAGRAIAAARLIDDWQLRAHGLTFVPNFQDIGLSKLVPKRRRADSFHRVATAIGSPVPSVPVVLGKAFSAVPSLGGLHIGARRHPHVLRYHGDWIDSKPAFVAFRVGDLPHELALRELRTVDMDEAAVERLRAYLRSYPTIQGWELESPDVMPTDIADWGKGWTVSLRLRVGEPLTVVKDPIDRWVGLASHLDRLGEPTGAHDGLLIPATGDAVIRPLMAWWMVLFALSVLARYHPDDWLALINVDESQDAVAFEVALTKAIEHIPELVLASLSGRESWHRRP